MRKVTITRAHHHRRRSGRMRITRMELARSFWLSLCLLPAVALIACDHRHGGHHYTPDYAAPATPRGLWSITQDERVELEWYPNEEEDLAGYRIYRNDRPTGYYDRIATVGRRTTRFLDDRVTNGETYYYAIAAIDESDNESELSEELVHDTPRPEGFDLPLSNAAREPRDAGYDFSRYRILDAEDIDADIYFWFTEEDGYWMVATEREEDVFTDIQDDGFRDLDSVDWAPEDGWSPTGDVRLIEGHSYVVWTWDDHYAKFRVRSLSPNEVVIDWAYQSDRGNQQLRAPTPLSPREGSGSRQHRAGLKAEVNNVEK
jgi:hypothetical protein